MRLALVGMIFSLAVLAVGIWLAVKVNKAAGSVMAVLGGLGAIVGGYVAWNKHVNDRGGIQGQYALLRVGVNDKKGGSGLHPWV